MGGDSGTTVDSVSAGNGMCCCCGVEFKLGTSGLAIVSFPNPRTTSALDSVLNGSCAIYGHCLAGSFIFYAGAIRDYEARCANIASKTDSQQSYSTPSKVFAYEGRTPPWCYIASDEALKPAQWCSISDGSSSCSS